jgi:hypothetical protein
MTQALEGSPATMRVPAIGLVAILLAGVGSARPALSSSSAPIEGQQSLVPSVATASTADLQAAADQPGAAIRPFRDKASSLHEPLERAGGGMLAETALQQRPAPAGTPAQAVTLIDIFSPVGVPDSMGAVGPSQFLLTINQRIRTYDKATGLRDGVLDLEPFAFFRPATGSSVFGPFDPVSRYDRLSGRWFIMMAHGTSAPGQLLLAVSDAGIISATTHWSFFNFPAPAGCWADFPSLAVDALAVYMTSNAICPGENRYETYVIRKSSLLAGGPAVVTKFEGLHGRLVDSIDPNAGEGYLAIAGAFRRISDPAGTPTVSDWIHFYYCGSSFGGLDGFPLAPRHKDNNRESGVPGDNTGRMFLAILQAKTAVVRHGRLWVAVAVGVDNEGTSWPWSDNRNTRTAIGWREVKNIGTNAPCIEQDGVLFGPTEQNAYDARNYWMPGMMVSGQGHIAVGGSSAGTHEYINGATAGRLASDPPGTTRSPVLFTHATAPYNPPVNLGQTRRWGDYSVVSLDPCDDMTMWTVQEFTAAANTPGVAIAKLAAPPPAMPQSASPAAIPLGASSIAVTVTGSAPDGQGFYDPGPSFGCRLRAAVDGGVIVTSVTYHGPTSLTVEMSTVGAQAGLRTLTVTNPDGQQVSAAVFTVDPCLPGVAPAQATYSRAGGSGSAAVTVAPGCPAVSWTASSSVSFVQVTSGASGSGSGSVGYTVSPNPGAARRHAQLTIAGMPFSILQEGHTIALSHNVLNFGGANTGGVLNPLTSAQVVAVTTDGPVPIEWSVTANQPWVSIENATGAGNGTFTVAIVNPGNVLGPSSSVTATLTVSSPTAGNAPQAVLVNLSLLSSASLGPPIGHVDTPLHNASGVTGSIPVTGWAMDDVEVKSVRIYRDPVPGEGTGPVFIGDAVFVDGARPDIQGAFPMLPLNTRAGWGYMMLTNFLPNGGNGTFRLHAYAQDAEGHTVLLGSATITCDNANATRPFGAIDTPGQGETVSGVVNNFGWVLAHGTRRADPPGGGTVQVVVNGAFVGAPFGWTSRPDLTALFPAGQYAGIGTALGVFPFDTTSLGNGVHTIQWVVTDHLGNADGVGSRYFTVRNGTAGAVTAPVSPVAARASVETSAGSLVLRGRRGYAAHSPWQALPDGLLDGEELDRFEVAVAPGATGYLRTADGLGPLPIGSRLDPASGVFTWHPGVGFVGTYDFLFEAGGHRADLRIVLHPKGSSRVGPQVVVDAPAASQSVARRFTVVGWAADLDDSAGTGVDAVHVWAYPVDSATGMRLDPVFLGAAAYGGERPDVATVHGDARLDSGFRLTVDRLEPGTYDLAVFAWSTMRQAFVPAQVVRVSIR